MTIKAHFDGKVFVPDEPTDLPAGQAVDISIRLAPKENERMTGAGIVEFLRQNPELKQMWDEIAADRDSVEVARELRSKTWARNSKP